MNSIMKKEIEKQVETRPTEGKASGEGASPEVYLYRAAGIGERHRTVPIWLQMVADGLSI